MIESLPVRRFRCLAFAVGVVWVAGCGGSGSPGGAISGSDATPWVDGSPPDAAVGPAPDGALPARDGLAPAPDGRLAPPDAVLNDAARPADGTTDGPLAPKSDGAVGPADAGTDGGPVRDAAAPPSDAAIAPLPDAGPEPTPDAAVSWPDAAVPPRDAAIMSTPDAAVLPPVDAALPVDVAVPPLDAAVPDAPPLDAAVPDALPLDAAVPDALPLDAAVPDALPLDAAVPPIIDAAAPPIDAAVPACIPFNTPDGGPPPLDAAVPPVVDAAVPPPPVWPVDRTGLALELALDGDFTDTAGHQVFAPFRAGGFAPANRARGGNNQAYGPTGQTVDNGARAAGLTTLPTADGLTFEGWFLKAGNNGSGTLFGFGDSSWAVPTLAVTMAWGDVVVMAGSQNGRTAAHYGRPGDCWHHIAVVFPPGFDHGVAYQVYLDGARVAATSGSEVVGPNALNAPFDVGRFTLGDGARMAVDEVRVWTRALTPDEVAAAATAQGPGPDCRPGARAWEPGPLCVPLADPPPFRPAAEVRVLTDEWVAVYEDPTPWLLDRYVADCGTYLDAMERNADLVAAWWMGYQYRYAWEETRLGYEPDLLTALDVPFELVDCDGTETPALEQHPWIEGLSELNLPRPWVPGGRPQKTVAAKTAFVTYVHLPRPLVPGETVAIRDAGGYELPLTYSDDDTRSWALKNDQLGYLPDAPKSGWLGAWIPAAGALDLSMFDGAAFDVVDEADGSVAYTGTVVADISMPEQTGEQLWRLDFTPLQRPGRYHLRLPQVGRSTSFEIGTNPMGEAFYTYARGLYHNRCAPLDPAHTPWARGDIHQTFRGGLAPLTAPENPQPGNDYADHSAEGWGFLNAAGQFVSYDNFSSATRTATNVALPNVTGGWHDAGDFDRRSFHLRAVEDLVETYLFNPTAFTDGQLNLPESGNGRPDLLDEAVWGLEIWRQAQQPDGGVGVWIEATSHPQIMDPGLDTQPYYTSLPTRNSTLIFARSAALLSRALRLSGDVATADTFLEAARRAYSYGTNPNIRVQESFTAADGTTHRFLEAPTPSPQRVLWATTELWLATRDPAYWAVLNTPAERAVYTQELGNLWWRNQLSFAASIAADPASFPDTWGALALTAFTHRAADWIAGEAALPYRHAWYVPNHPYFNLRGWGSDLYVPLRDLALTWRLTGDPQYRDAALVGLDFLHGSNPMGRVHVTGLGQDFSTQALHLPSLSDELDEPVPGIPLYGPSAGIPHTAWEQVYGLMVDARADPVFPGISAVMMPPSLTALVAEPAGLRDWLGLTIPGWRRFVALEQTNVPTMEFTVWETTAPATMVTGLLLPPGYTPPDDLRLRQPRTAAQLQSAHRIMP